MPWPALSEIVKGIDVSKYQNPSWDDPGDKTVRRIDWARLRQVHPEIIIACVRLAGSTSGIDPDFAYNYDESEAHGFIPIPYVNANPGRSLSELTGWWRTGMGDRHPRCTMLDCETDQDQLPSIITRHVQDCGRALHDLWPVDQIVYSADWWWKDNIVHGWEGSLDMFVANYRYLVELPDGKYRVPYTFEEADRCLPIDNNFTPKICTGTSTSQTVGWQFTSDGQLEGIQSEADLDYFKLSWFVRVFGSTQPPSTQPIPIEIRFPVNAVEFTMTPVER